MKFEFSKVKYLLDKCFIYRNQKLNEIGLLIPLFYSQQFFDLRPFIPHWTSLLSDFSCFTTLITCSAAHFVELKLVRLLEEEGKSTAAQPPVHH